MDLIKAQAIVEMLTEFMGEEQGNAGAWRRSIQDNAKDFLESDRERAQKELPRLDRRLR